VRRTFPRRVILVALAVFVASGALGVFLTRWYAKGQMVLAHGRVSAAMLPFANTAAAATGRHVARMAGLKAFVESRRDLAQLDAEFEAYASRLIKNANGVVAVQIVRGGRIAREFPASSAGTALGMDLRNNRSATIRADFARVMSSEYPSVIGPAALLQGGQAFVIDQRVHAPFDSTIDLVAMLVDQRAVVKDLEFGRAPAWIAVEVHDSSGTLIGRTGGALPSPPDTAWAEVRGGTWMILAGPSAGWDAAIAGPMLPVRIATTVIVLLLTLLAVSLADRDARLTKAVDQRTASLRELVAEHAKTIRRQEESERALAAHDERLRLALAAAKMGTFEIDASTGKAENSSEVALMHGLPATSSVESFDEMMTFLGESDAAQVRAQFVRGSRSPTSGTVEFRSHGRDGITRWLVATWMSQADETGVVRRFVGTLTDITERKDLEERFLHSQKMEAMGSLAGGIAHDFNNLLTVIIGAGQMARSTADMAGVPESVRVDLDEVLAAGERASVMTGQLLAFSRRQVVQPRHFDACDLVGGMGAMLRRLVGEHIRVETALPGTTVPLYADHGQLTQVVMNLAVNARDAMPDGGTLRINLRTGSAPAGDALPGESLLAERFAVLSVSDTGTGIDPAIQHMIFDPFFTTKPVGKGTGLGLSTVYGIVTQLGGTVRLASEAGKGTTFDVYLPLAAGTTEEVPTAITVPSDDDAPTRTLLLAEDEQGLRRVLERILVGAGYRVIVAEDGTAALAASRAHEGHIDLLVSDVVMPNLGGLELASTLLRERPTLRVLMMSGYPQHAGQGTAVSLADTSFLAKPFKPTDLLHAVRRTLAEA